MEFFAQLVISIFGSAFIAGVVCLVSVATGHDPSFPPIWFVVFLAWWGVVLIDGNFL